ncbi:unnamed protein product [Discula destructiva]
MSSNNIMSNRNSTPEAGSISSLRPPSARAAIGSGNQLRASADMTTLTGTPQSKNIRPSSDFYGGQAHAAGGLDPQDKMAQQWVADIDQYEDTLEEMATATLDQDFKDELFAIEQWFKVLSEAERTAALYQLLQQTTQVQIRFFIQVLQEMAKKHPMSSVMSPANFDKDPMTERMTDAMGKLGVNESARNSLARGSTAGKRQSGLDSSVINAMFPDAAAAIATQKAQFTQKTGAALPAQRNSTIDRNSLVAPTISAPEGNGQGVSSPWRSERPKSTTGQTPMGQFQQPPPPAGLHSPLPQITGNSQIKSTTINAGEKSDLPLLSPYGGGGNWASMVNTPMAPNFNIQQQSTTQADMVANATAMKLAAFSTVNNRLALDDPRRYRRARSNDAPGSPLPPGMQNVGSPLNIVMTNERGQALSTEQMLALQHASLQQGGSRPNSPGFALQGQMSAGFQPMGAFASPQANGFLNPYASSPLMNNGMSLGMGGIGMGGLSLGHHGEGGYLSDHSDMNRGRSPRGRRGTSKPPEDPTDPALLQDIPSWLRSLRLHKYTDNLKDLKWSELVELDDAALEKRGVNALGARRKMLKVFEQVKEAKSTGKLAP